MCLTLYKANQTHNIFYLEETLGCYVRSCILWVSCMKFLLYWVNYIFLQIFMSYVDCDVIEHRRPQIDIPQDVAKNILFMYIISC